MSLYGALLRTSPSPVVELNRAAAISMADGPGAALSLVERIRRSGTLDRYYLLHATEADLLRRLDRREEAAAAYARALELTTNAQERRFLRSRLDEARREG